MNFASLCRKYCFQITDACRQISWKFLADWSQAEKTVFFFVCLNIAYSIYSSSRIFYKVFPNSYGWTELFVSYEGGVIRRGLLGSILSIFAGQEYFRFAVTAIVTAIWILWLLCVAKLLFRYLERFWAIILLGAPGLFVSSCYNLDPAKKELFIEIGFFLIFFLIASAKKHSFGIAKVLCYITVIYVPVFLTHELALFFITLPACILLGIYKTAKNKLTILIYFSLLIAGSVIFAFIFKGNFEQRDIILHFWQHFYPELELGGAIKFIGYGLFDRTLYNYSLPYIIDDSLRTSIIQGWILTLLPIIAFWYRYNLNKASIILLGKFWTISIYCIYIFMTITIVIIMNDFGRIISITGIIILLSEMCIISTYKNTYGEITIKNCFIPQLNNYICFSLSLLYLFSWKICQYVPLSANSYLDIQFWQKKLMLCM